MVPQSTPKAGAPPKVIKSSSTSSPPPLLAAGARDPDVFWQAIESLQAACQALTTAVELLRESRSEAARAKVGAKSKKR